jgi:uncharacterized protein
MEYKKETTSVEGSWPLEHWEWKQESIGLIAKSREAFKDHKLLGLKCPDCGLVYFLPKPYCRCMGIPNEYVEVQDTGTITTYTFTGAWKYEGGTTVDEGAPAEPPLIICGVMLDGADTMSVVTLYDAEPEEVAVGMRIKLRWPDPITGGIDDVAHATLLRE